MSRLPKPVGKWERIGLLWMQNLLASIKPKRIILQLVAIREENSRNHEAKNYLILNYFFCPEHLVRIWKFKIVDILNRLELKMSTDPWVVTEFDRHVSNEGFVFLRINLFCWVFLWCFRFWCLVSEKQEILISYRNFDF